ncbi:MAG: regulatory protein RecX, partial [Solirubrobacteraceae bacterium]
AGTWSRRSSATRRRWPPSRPRLSYAAMAVGSEEERLQKALDLASAYVNPRDRTVSEVRRHLQRRGVSEELTETAIQALDDQGFLDDCRFARLFVADKRTLEQWGSERIRRGLLSRGIGRHLIDAALEAQPDAVDEEGVGGSVSELDRALALLRRRFPEPPQERRDRNRALGMLLRKGYESEVALDALAAHARGD